LLFYEEELRACEAQQGAQEFRAVLFGADLYGTDLNGARRGTSVST